MRKALRLNHIMTGVCYYPEHWDPALWRDDLRRMKAAGIEAVRIAEFAWTVFEPKENEFTFEFFDSFMDLAFEEDMKVIFCTPTATPPAWMSHRYPEILNADMDGHLMGHGHRRHSNLTSERFRYFTARITEKLGEHYGKHPCVVAWQLDNEINCESTRYLAESDHAAFRAWLQKRFGTLDAFNNAIGALSPPMGTLMFVVCGITKCKTKDFIKEAVPFYIMLVIVLLLLTFFPIFTTGLVNLVY